VTLDADPSGEPLRLGQTVLLPTAAGSIRLVPISDSPAVLLDAYLP
jgi:hypothetical protein